MIEITSFIIGYLFGSFPTAYLLIKRIKKLDITENGSGNVGAMNSYKITKSKFIGASVLLIDFLKGFFPVLIIRFFFGDIFIYEMLGLIAAVLAHSYSPWIKFKGGRGLATAAGGISIISLPVLLIWAVIWLIAFAFRRNRYFSNFTATLLTAVLSFSSAKVMIKYSMISVNTEFEYGFLISLMMMIILLKHIQPMKEYLQTQNKKAR